MLKTLAVIGFYKSNRRAESSLYAARMYGGKSSR